MARSKKRKDTTDTIAENLTMKEIGTAVQDGQTAFWRQLQTRKHDLWDMQHNPDGHGVDMEAYDALVMYEQKLMASRKGWIKLCEMAEVAPWREGAPRQTKMGEGGVEVGQNGPEVLNADGTPALDDDGQRALPAPDYETCVGCGREDVDPDEMVGGMCQECLGASPFTKDQAEGWKARLENEVDLIGLGAGIGCVEATDGWVVSILMEDGTEVDLSTEPELRAWLAKASGKSAEDQPGVDVLPLDED